MVIVCLYRPFIRAHPLFSVGCSDIQENAVSGSQVIHSRFLTLCSVLNLPSPESVLCWWSAKEFDKLLSTEWNSSTKVYFIALFSRYIPFKSLEWVSEGLRCKVRRRGKLLFIFWWKQHPSSSKRGQSIYWGWNSSFSGEPLMQLNHLITLGK